ncbi:MAG: matrixin family metalloprotease [Methanobacteriota archaeon]
MQGVGKLRSNGEREAHAGLRVLLLIAFIVPAIAGPLPTASATPPGLEEYPEPARGPKVDVGAAPVIVRGVAGETRSAWSPEGEILSYTTFAVDRVERGDPAPTITVETRGGRVDDLVQVTTHQAVFRGGERARLFLAPAGDEVYRVVGGDQGKQAPAGAPIHEEATACGSGYCLEGPKWKVTALPVHYRVNENTGDLSGEGALVNAGFAAWENDGPSFMDWTYDGSTAITTMAFDGTNAVFWRAVNQNYLAVASYWYYTGTPYDHMAQFDVQFDDSDAWSNGAVSGRFDVQSVATHEAGHALGLDHINDGNQVMNPTISSGTTKRTLGSGDLAGLRVLYTNDAPTGVVDAVTCTSVRGWAFDVDESDVSIQVHVYIDGTGYNTGATSVFRGDVNAAYGIAGTHGYDWAPPTSWLNGATHSVTVYAINIPGGSNPVIGTGSFRCGPPSAPQNLQATGAGAGLITLSWTAPSTNNGLPLSGYDIYRGTAPGSESYLTSVGPATTTYTDSVSLLAPTASYYYKVRATNLGGAGPFSNTACGKPVPEVGPLAC